MTTLSSPLQAWLPGLLFAVGLCLLGPWWGVFEMDTDEGLNLMKAMLVADGHEMFSEIWSDQPPLLTYILAGVHRIFGNDIAAARGTILFFSSLLIWALFRMVRREEGAMAAWVAVAILVSGTLYQRLSVSVMIGLPALALALLALDQMLGARGRLPRYALSGLLMALALQTKMFTVLLLPGLLLALWIDGRRFAVTWRTVGGTFGLALAGTFGGLALLAGPEFIDQLITPHLQAGLDKGFPYDRGADRLWSLLLDQPQYLVMGGLGVLLAWPWHKASRWIPVIGAVGASVALYRHTPLWIHQLLLIQIPLAWLAGCAAGRLVEGFRLPSMLWRGAAIGLGVLLVVGGGWLAVQQTTKTAALFHRSPTEREQLAVQALKARTGETRWLVTDRPIDGYYAQLPVIPPLAVYSLKRVRGGLLTPEQVAEWIRTYRPEQVSYRRFYMGKAVKAYLKEHYTKVEGLKAHLLYLRKDLSKDH
ncbi:glycosyltransferase family 39 protein [Magnetospira sp. QH-2]|uniref:ArnT family glycosyltransferase n=1 Tax=Magnetospira sp. (strain QH-2) TaxID=1288970 RepID=UPI0003E81560|nr:glycosyltransferase family 39 protein [Magnetospira sp. QH-2]CCQ75322.1 membrane protein of unknown function [Magnetospira sp. QH-2]